MDPNTVDDDDLPPLTAEWLAEVDRRSAEFDAGAVMPISWEQIKSEAMRRAGLTLPILAVHSLHSGRSPGRDRNRRPKVSQPRTRHGDLRSSVVPRSGEVGRPATTRSAHLAGMHRC